MPGVKKRTKGARARGREGARARGREGARARGRSRRGRGTEAILSAFAVFARTRPSTCSTWTSTRRTTTPRRAPCATTRLLAKRSARCVAVSVRGGVRGEEGGRREGGERRRGGRTGHRVGQGVPFFPSLTCAVFGVRAGMPATSDVCRRQLCAPVWRVGRHEQDAGLCLAGVREGPGRQLAGSS